MTDPLEMTDDDLDQLGEDNPTFSETELNLHDLLVIYQAITYQGVRSQSPSERYDIAKTRDKVKQLLSDDFDWLIED